MWSRRRALTPRTEVVAAMGEWCRCFEQAGIGKEFVRALFVGIGHRASVQLLGHEHRGLGLPAVEDGECVVTKWPLLRAWGQDGRLATSKELTAFCKRLSTWTLGRRGGNSLVGGTACMGWRGGLENFAELFFQLRRCQHGFDEAGQLLAGFGNRIGT